jgi:hypothetical protein
MKKVGHCLVWAGLTLSFAMACSERSQDPGNASAAADRQNNVTGEASDLVPCDQVLSEAQWAQRDRGPAGRAVNALVLKANGRFRWNGAEIDATVLRQYLDLVSTMTPSPMLVVSVEPGVKESQRRETRGLIGESLQCQPRRAPPRRYA